jgi:multidrug efflux pump subunit AcrB
VAVNSEQNPSQANEHLREGIIGWFARNHVAANLLMFFVCALGLLAIFSLKKESMPAFTPEEIEISVPYPGAGPEEVELGIVIKIEEALNSIQGIKEIRSYSREGTGQVRVEVETGYELADMTDLIKLAVDSISTFPVDSERPIITRQERKMQALTVQISGDLDQIAMANLADQIKDEITALPQVTYAEIWGKLPFEIAVEISELKLREFGLTLGQVAEVIRRWSIDLPGGSIRTEGGNIRLRASGQAYTGAEFADIVLLTNPDGSRIMLDDVAVIKDGFVEAQFFNRFNGVPGIGINVQSTDKENEIEISEAVHRYVESRRNSLPEGVKLDIWNDATFFLNSQMNMLLKNMALGFLLVFAVLSLFLRLRLATWVVIGLPVAFLGAFMMLPYVGVTINILSLFAFILVLGIVVDDAIIVGESAHSETERSGYTVESIIAGTRKVAVPATFGVLTTVMAFLPMLFITGEPSTITQAIGFVVIFCLLFSLVESKLILPSHLALAGPPKKQKSGLTKIVDIKLKQFIEKRYKPFLEKAIEYRYTTLSTFVALIILVVGFSAGGFVKYGFFPDIDTPRIMVSVEITEGSPEELSTQILDELLSTLKVLRKEVVEELGEEGDFANNVFGWVNNNRFGQVQIDLKPNEDLLIKPAEIEKRWREKVGEIAGVKELRFMSKQKFGGDADVGFRLVGKDADILFDASEELVDYLRGTEGVYEVRNSYSLGPQELDLNVKPSAEALGITLADLARQVREAFFGAEAQRVQRGNNEVRVMVRYPMEERRSIGDLESMWIQLPDRTEVPFNSVAEYSMGYGKNAIQRIDKQRAISVRANINKEEVEAREISFKTRKEFIPRLLSRYPGVSMELGDSSRAEDEATYQLAVTALLVLMGIYALLAIPLRSYVQPLIIMSVVPFGLIGAILGHALLGKTVSMVSIMGFIALTGVVVNDSLIMVDFVNRKLKEGIDHARASMEAGAERFRAIVLTSLTTFFGLIPILFETSTQAQMITPMAISLAFGILFSTLITLVLVPALYNILRDFVGVIRGSKSPVASTTFGG